MTMTHQSRRDTGKLHSSLMYTQTRHVNILTFQQLALDGALPHVFQPRVSPVNQGLDCERPPSRPQRWKSASATLVSDEIFSPFQSCSSVRRKIIPYMATGNGLTRC